MKRNLVELVEEFLNFNRGELVQLGVSDYRLARRLKIRHIRSGKICDPRAEGAGTEVLAYGYDGLGNIIALCKDGHVRQFVS